jgi:NitT/TauT family transport system substrate-binding protein
VGELIVRSRFTGLLAALALLAFGAHGAFAQTALPVVRVVGPPNDGYKAVFYGVKAGIFKKYGIDVQTSIVASGAAAAAALSGSGADVAYTNILTLIQAHTHNVPMVFVAAGNLQLPGTSQTKTIVAADSTIKSGKDMIGKTLGSASLRDINAAATLAWIDKTGGDSKQIKVVEVPASAGAAFLEEHRADAITLNEPAVSQAVATGKAKVLAQPYDAVGAGMTAGFAAMAPYVAANRDVMERFAKAMHEASLYTNAHPADTVDIVAQYSGVPPDVVAKSVRFSDAEFLEPRYLQPMIDLCAHYNLIDRDFPAREVISDVAVKPPR